MATYWGFSYGHHDAAGVVIDDGKLVYAKRAQEYTNKPNDKNIHPLMVGWMDTFTDGLPDQIYLHENKRRDLWRKIRYGDWSRIWTKSPRLPKKPIQGNHHLSHAAAGYYTSGFYDAIVLVADAIGENESLAVYAASSGRLQPTPLFTMTYPDSLGLFYSYHTARIGMTPLRDENKFMELSKQSWIRHDQSVYDTVNMEGHIFQTTRNLHHTPKVIDNHPDVQARIAATTQDILEGALERIYLKFKDRSKNLVFTGGVAYNTLAVNRLRKHAKNVYVPSHPGDAGSALGAILQHTHQHIELPNGRMFT
jgi:carbamoyltransferase